MSLSTVILIFVIKTPRSLLCYSDQELDANADPINGITVRNFEDDNPINHPGLYEGAYDNGIHIDASYDDGVDEGYNFAIDMELDNNTQGFGEPVEDGDQGPDEEDLQDQQDDAGLLDLLGWQNDLRLDASNRDDPTFSKTVRTKYFKGAARVLRKGATFVERFFEDRFANIRAQTNNVYYPMSSYEEWEFVNTLMRMKTSLAEKTRLLQTSLVSFLMLIQT
jgi:hypothetical protein